MLYDITARIDYTYSVPTSGTRHSIRLMPPDLMGEQRLIAGALDITPRPDERVERVDFFGNRTVDLVCRARHAAVRFTLQARINRMAHAQRLDMSPVLADMGAEIARHGGMDARAPHHYLGPSARIKPDAAIAAFAREALLPGMTALEAVRALNLALHHWMQFDAEATNVETPASEAFARQKGVCQDFSHIMITGLRALGIPAGYVSGFLRTVPPQGEARLEGADAMHAWVMAWCGQETGWVEFDPTNAAEVGQDHIVVARGRDYSDVSPVKGILWLAGGQRTDQAVDVVPIL